MDSSIKQRYLFSQKLIKEAGEIALNFYLNREDLSIEYKKGEKLDLVSIADKKVEAHIKSALVEKFPDDGFLGEETGSNGIESEFCWVVDPIDGTSPFLYGLHAWCVSIAILKNNQIVAGAVFDPVHNELFHAARGQGAFLNNKPINTTDATSVKDGLMGLGMSHRVPADTFTPILNQLLNEGGMFIRNGSGALMLSYVAAGRLIGYFEPHINSWDVCAGILLVEEAGGNANDFLEDGGLYKGNYILATSSKDIYKKIQQMRNN